MSNRTFVNLWRESQKQLEELVVQDYQIQAVEDNSNKQLAHRSIFELYIKYILCANKLEEVYDQMVQPQKRLLVRKLLDGCLGRVLELKFDLVGIDMTEFSYNDEVLSELNLMPDDVELRIPRYFTRERADDIEYKKKFIDSLLIKMGWLDDEAPEERLTETEAIRTIQMHERARQGRLRAQFMKEIRQLKEKGKPDGIRDQTDGLVAAMKIQKVWRGYVTRCQTRRGKLDEMYLIGMTRRPSERKAMLAEEAEKQKHRRYKIQQQYKDEYEKALELAKTEIKQKHAIPLSEDIADEIRTWFKEYHTTTGKFPDFPTEECGGSRHLLSRQATESEISRSSAVSSKDSKKTRDKSRTPTKFADLNVEDEFDGTFKITQSSFLADIKSNIDEYNEIWCNKDESKNVTQRPYDEMIYSSKYGELEQEIRNVIDDLLRQELMQLQLALDRDRAQRGKKSKKSAKKSRRSGKKSKKKKEKDLTPDRTTESLFEELVINGIIRKYPKRQLTSFFGDRAYAQRSGVNPTTGDVRQLLTEYAILPLGSETIRNCVPCVRSLLIAGPKGSGKKSLVHSICTEVGAVLFDLTPANIVGKYPGKSGLIMLMHLVQKVSRLLQPSVIFMDNAETPFMKKVSKGDRTDPKRLKKDLPKLIKNICIEDRVIFIGTTSAPWEADQKLLQQTYNRFIYIPQPDYGTLSFVLRELLNKYCEAPVSFDPGALAKVFDGYTIGSIEGCIRDVLTCKRKLQLRIRPLVPVELINALCTRDPVYREEAESFSLWWAKTPLGKRKQRYLELEQEAKQEKDKKSGDRRSKKKK